MDLRAGDVGLGRSQVPGAGRWDPEDRSFKPDALLSRHLGGPKRPTSVGSEKCLVKVARSLGLPSSQLYLRMLFMLFLSPFPPGSGLIFVPKEMEGFGPIPAWVLDSLRPPAKTRHRPNPASSGPRRFYRSATERMFGPGGLWSLLWRPPGPYYVGGDKLAWL